MDYDWTASIELSADSRFDKVDIREMLYNLFRMYSDDMTVARVRVVRD